MIYDNMKNVTVMLMEWKCQIVMPNCNVTVTTRQICQDEVHIEITFDSKNLNSALSFEPGTTYYLISEFHTVIMLVDHAIYVAGTLS